MNNKKKNKIYNISLGTFVMVLILIACVVFIAYIQKWDILGKLTSPQAFLGYMLIFIIGLLVITETWKAKVMGEDEDED